MLDKREGQHQHNLRGECRGSGSARQRTSPPHCRRHRRLLPARPPTPSRPAAPRASGQVSITPLDSAGAWIPSIWATASGVDTRMYQQFTECPLTTSLELATDGTQADIQAKIVNTFGGFIYGFNTATPPMAKREHAVTAITFGGASAAGRVTLTRAGGNLVYVITEVSGADSSAESRLASCGGRGPRGSTSRGEVR